MSTRNPPRLPRAKPQGGRPRIQAPPPASAPVSGPATASAAAPAPIAPYGVDPALVDWRRVAAGIAVDEAAPAAARVAACRLLAAHGAGPPLAPPSAYVPPAGDEPLDELTRRSLAILAARGRPN